MQYSIEVCKDDWNI